MLSRWCLDKTRRLYHRMQNSLSRLLSWFQRHEWSVVGSLAAAAFALGIAGLWRHQQFPDVWNVVWWCDAVYFALRLFTFELDLGSTETDPYVFDTSNWPLQIARFLAPATLAFAVVKGLMLVAASNYNLWRLSRWKGHAVVCGAGERGRRLALALRQEGKDVAVIEKDADCDMLADIRAAGARVVIGSVTDAARQRDARLDTASIVAAVTPCVESNLQVVLAASRRPRRLPVRALAYAPRSFAAMFDSQPPFDKIKDGCECGFFDHDAAAARLLVGEYAPPLVPTLLRERRPPRILVAGNGDLIPELLGVLVTQCQYADAGIPHIELLTVDQDAVAREFPLHHPAMPMVAELKSRELSLPQLLRTELSPPVAGEVEFDLAFVACCEDVDTLALARSFAQQEGLITGPVVAGLRPSTQLMRLFTVSQPLPGVMLHDLVALGCSADIVLRGRLDADARRIHQSYLDGELKKGRKKGETPTLVEWENLADGVRQANRAQADHMPIKRRTLEESTTPATIEALAEAEHRRWVAEKIVAGWRYAAIRDDSRRLHNSIRPYGDLSEAEKEKDRDTVRAVAASITTPR
jgi:hypothetical protein